MKIIILSILVLLSLSCGCFCCNPGNIKSSNNPESLCVACAAGHYCPAFGGDMYACPDGSIAPGGGYVVCVPCKSQKTDEFKTKCLFADTPTDAKRAQNGQLIDLKANVPQYFYGNIPFGYYLSDPQTFVTIVNNEETELFVSTTSGKPSAENSEYKNIGKNSTVTIQRQKNSKEFEKFIYFRVKSTKDSKAVINFTSILPIVNVLPNSETKVTAYNEGIIPILVDQVPMGANLNITIEGSFSQAEPLQFAICYSSDASIEMPTLFNSNQVAYASKIAIYRSKASLLIRKVSNSKVRVSFYMPNNLNHGELRINANIVN